ncbi:non-ribosomal peptide synthetase/type I polyketide synthase [Amycolatopsis sp. YIM 10]|uniref:non-ribosomal peptide synthetase/type I polyketide synthase n=1 Tax=Amycolatopsis sp. YIM 10 TaxID=2653857 RepID=UPI0012908090|nr:non-ribosomal peptide synthetase/type I polyketide synthase [Amycolatopsis sp. YIM 10]QFU89908.1 Linear gramicidin synthase subunit D [Amycolatopsis sp. YIM 10]
MDLITELLAHPLVHDAALEDRHAGRVLHVVPAPGADPAETRRAATGLALSPGSPLLVSVVSRIPRDHNGKPDPAKLAALPVAVSAGAPVPARPPVTAPPADATPADQADDEHAPSSHVSTGSPVVEPDDPQTVREAMFRAAEQWPERGVTVVDDRGTRQVTFPELLRRAGRALGGLRAAGIEPGDAVILHCDDLEQHFVGLWACLLGGFHPVAVAPAADYGERNPVLDKFEHAWHALGEPVVLSGGELPRALRNFGARHGFGGGAGIVVLDVADCERGEPAEPAPAPAPGDVAILQLSSGSTGVAKVIPLTHRGIVRYAQDARAAIGLRTGDVFVNWLPLDHVGGVAMFHLGPLVLGCETVHTPTARVLADPLRWLDLLHEHRAQHSWAPNFGFRLLAGALDGHDGRRWDLSAVRTLTDAGEQCTQPVLDAFLRAVTPFGLDPGALVLAWGMAETCTALTFERYGHDAVQHVRDARPGAVLHLTRRPGPGSTTFLSMGAPAPGNEIRIAGPDGATLPERRIGRLLVRSERVLPGYRDNPEADRAAFPGDGWFDTGDLGFVVDGKLTVTGRAKEILIVNGVHHFCHEIEALAGTVTGVRAGLVAAVGVPDASGTERPALVYVPDGPAHHATGEKIRSLLATRLGLTAPLLVPIPEAAFERTTSGKIRRAEMRVRLLAGAYGTTPAAPPSYAHRPEWVPRAFTRGRSGAAVLAIADPRGLVDRLAEQRDGVTVLRRGEPLPAVLPPTVLFAPSTVDANEVARTLELFGALAAAGWTGTLVVVTAGVFRVTGTEAPGWPAALLAGLADGYAADRTGVRAWHLDLAGTDLEADAARLAEALDWQHSEPVVAWRDNLPVTRVLVPVGLTGTGPGFEPGSRWLVTGGHGGLGRVVVDELRRAGVQLLVTGRSPAPPELGDVRYAVADVRDLGALEAAVTAAEREWDAPLDGVLHLAGTFESAPATELTAAAFDAATGAKVAGARNAAELVRARPGSRLVLVSSLLSRFPAAATGAYVAANRFTEALAEHLGAHCLVWPLVRDTGVSAGGAALDRVHRRRMRSLNREDVPALTIAALRLPPGTVLFGVDHGAPLARQAVDPPWALETVVGRETDAFGVPLPPPAETAAPEPAQVGQDSLGPARQVREALREVLPGGTDPATPFHEAGLGSVELVRLHDRLRRALGRDLPLTALFEHASEAALVRYLSGSTNGSNGSIRPAAAQATGRIAVIGMAARFPGASTLEQYWANLSAGRVSLRRFSRSELLAAGLPPELVDHPDYVPVSGALDDIAGFDADLFGLSPREAALTDPQQRLFLQVCHEALEHGGYGRSEDVAVYAGGGMSLYSLRNYLMEQLSDVDRGDQLAALQVAIGNQPDFLATRVAYRLGLTGPAMSVQTACSTSLVAVHLAARSLLAGETRLALAGAAAVHVPQACGYRYQEGSILSRTGACRAFDAAADGTVGGNGVAAVLLKRLEDAIADGDTVHAVLLGSAVNNDGAAKAGYTAPGVAGQSAVIRQALAAAGVAPDSIGYLEAHGTGTAIGDPIELRAVRSVFGDRPHPLVVGSVKPNIGHLDSCAGLAGLIKTVLALRHGHIPPLAGFEEPNPELGSMGDTIRLASGEPWPTPGPRRAGVSALGVGGTNAHVVLEEPPAPVPPGESRGPYVIPLSARTAEALRELAARMADRLDEADPPRADDMLRTLGSGRRLHPSRLVVRAGTAAEAAAALRRGDGVRGEARPGPVVFAFSGQGSGTAGVPGWLRSDPAAAEVLDRCAARHARTWGRELFPAGAHTVATLLPALTAIQLAQAAALDAAGVRPDVVIGHSAGEYAALHVAGALSEVDVMQLAAVRGRLLENEVAEGAMLAVGDPAVARRIADAVPELALSVHNGPDQVVLAGPPDAVDSAERMLAADGVWARRLNVRRAFHTAAVDPILDELARHAAGVEWHPLRLPLLDGAGAVRHEPGTRLGPAHLRQHTRAPARYGPGIDALVAAGCTTFAELGPDSGLCALGRQWPGTTWLPAVRADVVDRLFCLGAEIDWGPGGRRVPLPAYPFQLSRHWAGPAGGTPQMPADDTLEQIREILARHLGDDPARIRPEASLLDLGADSLLMITMLRELETRFSVRIPMRRLFEELDTPAALATEISRQRPTPPATPNPAPAASPEPAAAPAPTAAVAPALASAAAAAPAPAAAPVAAAGAAPVAPAAAPNQTPASAPVVARAGGGELDSLIRDQLALVDKFTSLMSEQLAARSGGAPAPALAPPPEPTHPPEPPKPPQSPEAAQQLGPRADVGGTGMATGRLTSQQQRHFDELVDRYTRRTAKSKELAQRHRTRLADSRAIVGFRRATKELLYPITAGRATGAYLEDIDGNRYVDITMGFGTLLFGHDPAFLTEAVRTHLDNGLRMGPRGEDAGEAAALLCELTGADRAAFANSGTEANAAAFRLARAHTGRDLLVLFEGSYHGHSDPVLARSVRENGGLRTVPVSSGVPAAAVADTLVLPYGEPSSLDEIARHADRIAAVVVEPVPSRYPLRRPVEFVRALRELCDRHGMVLMFDEMLTGFRPHPRGARELFGVRPDLATYGKVIGGGLPIGAIAGRADLLDLVDGGFWRYGDDSVPERDTTFFGGTYIQHPLSMVAARAVLGRLRAAGPGLQADLNARTDRLAATLNSFAEEYEFPVRVEHFGSLFRFAHRGNLDLLFSHLMLEGVHVWEWRNFFLSTAHTDADVDFVLDAVRNSLHDLRQGGFLPGPATPAPAARRQPPAIPAPRPAAEPAPKPEPEPVPEIGRTTPDFSLYFFGDYPRDTPGEKYRTVLEATEFADRHGLHAVWLPERHFDSFGGIFPNPSVLAAALAGRTSRVRLNSGCAVLPLHDPIRVAEEWSVVDNLSGGRVGLGCASGWHAKDFVLAPDNYERHREVLYESIDTIRTLWRGDAVTRRAGNGEEAEVRLYPRPVQAEPEFYTAVVGNPESYRRAGAAGIGVVTNLMAQTVDQLAENIARYRRARADAGLDPDRGRVVLLLHTYLGTDTEQVRAEAFGPFCDYLRSSLALFGQLTNSLGFRIDLEHTHPDDVEFLLRRAYDQYCADRALIGTPEDAEAIVRRVRDLGVDEVACFVDFGLPPDRIVAALPQIDRLRQRFTAEPGTPLSPAEQRIWFLEQALPDRPTHTESRLIRLRGDLDAGALRAAVDTVVARHPALRSVFRSDHGEPRRVVLGHRPVELPVLDRPGDLADRVAEVVAEESAHGFDLAAGPLFDPRLLRLADDEHLLVLRMHHLVVDTWSAQVLTREISEAYRAHREGREPGLAPIAPVPPAEPESPADLEYWRAQLTPPPPEPALPLARPRPARPGGRGASAGAELGTELTARLKRYGRQSRATTFTVLLAAFAVVLRRFGGQSDLVLGTPVANRPQGTEEAVGFFVETLPLRLRIDPGAGFAALVRSARDTLMDAQEHRGVSFGTLAADLGTRGSLRNPLFDVAIEYDNGAVFEFDLPGLQAELLPEMAERAPFDLTLLLTDTGENIQARLAYDADLFDPATAGRLLDHLLLVLDTAIGTDDPIDDLPSITTADTALLSRWQDGGPPADGPRIVHEGARCGPVTDERGTTGGAELERRADAVTATLLAAGVGRGDQVALHLPRGADAVAAMLGTVRAGAAYLPLDPEHPSARKREMIGLGRVAALIGPWPEPSDVPVIGMDDLPAAEAPEPVDLTPDDPAYVLFTSGSTGRPKGVVVPHRAIANTIAWYVDGLGITGADRLSWFASPGFDASASETWAALRTGAPLYAVPPALRFDVPALRDWLVETGVTVASVPTPVGELLLGLDWPEGTSLRHLVIGGDRLRVHAPAGLPFRAWNIYGPTEAAVASTWDQVPADDGRGAPPIGRPVPGTTVEVLDDRRRPLPPGAAGELYLGGRQLAHGYLNDPDETGRRFADGRYRTGDIVRWAEDGKLRFLHRRDRQVQIRGNRVEPAEAERCLRALPGVTDAAVVPRTDGNGETYLAGYVVPSGGELDPRRLEAELGRLLPGYLIPVKWSSLPALPLNHNGKLDRGALPEPAAPAAAAAPSPLAARLAAIWADVLGVAEVAPDASFFELGGHSLNAVRLLNRVRAELGRTLDIPAFFQTPTVRGMADALGTDPFPLSVAQLIRYHRTVRASDPAVATIAVRLPLPSDVDTTALSAALTALTGRHPALRTVYLEHDGEVRQRVLPPARVELPRLDGGEEAVRDWARAPFDLTGAIGLRAAVTATPELLLALHHGIADGWSLANLGTELGELYRAASTGTPDRLPTPVADYADFVAWEQQYLANPATRARIRAWADRHRAVPGPSFLPPDDDLGPTALPPDAGDEYTVPLPPEIVASATALGAAAGCTTYPVFAAAFAAYVARLTGTPALAAGSAVVNRPDDRFEHVTGLFAQMSWLIVPVGGASTFTDLVGRAAQATRDLLALQSVPGSVLAAELGGAFDGVAPRLGFGMQSTDPMPLRLPGAPPVTATEIALGVSRTEQTWVVTPGDRNWTLTVEYATGRYRRSRIEALVAGYLELLDRLLAAPSPDPAAALVPEVAR